MKKTIIQSLITLLLLAGCGADRSYPGIFIGTPPADSAEITSFRPENYGYIIFNPENRSVIKAHNIHESFIPASVSKIFTTVFALETLGADYSFSTGILYAGSIRDGIIEGDLILRGGGDPELNVRDLLKMVFELKAEGIKKIRGKFYYDTSSFEQKEVLDKGMPVNARYNPGYGPLNLNGNIICAVKEKDETGKLISCFPVPAAPSISLYLYNEPPVYLYAKYKKRDNIETWGLPANGCWKDGFQLPVKDSGRFTAQIFRKLCLIHGITLPLPENGRATNNTKILVQHKSRKLIDIIKDMLISSNNLTAELLGTIASEKLRKPENEKTFSVENFFRLTFPSVKWDSFRLNSFSGLSDSNRATPEQTAAMLLYLNNLKEQGVTLANLLSLSGLDGTIKARFENHETAFRVSAKTGTLYYASALSGEFTANSGKNYYFAIYINDTEKRRLYMVSGNGNIGSANSAEKWTARAVKSIDIYIRSQIEKL
ncbi:MAG TPA: D-alanyl-D-alanine carboxypeptidase/D-alanyl-D-alanine-endopeptidase [Spirochaetota bacterium]|nr:D-alanyl-D-alanine carboxypeptidase/D-alanyl-D-alanine-endopeptidase [Spirochaetota bacterium]